MRIETLYEFLLLASNLSFTETARSLYMAQSALSSHISNLEKELGVRLLVRDSHSVRLTEVGALFCEDAGKIIADYETAISRIGLFCDSASSVMRVGFLLGSYGSFLPVACRMFRDVRPDVSFSFRTLEIGELTRELADNNVDVAFTLFSEGVLGGKYACRRLYADSYKLAAPKTHRLAQRASVTIDDLRGEVVVMPRFSSAHNTLAQLSVKLRKAGVDVRVNDAISDAAALMATLVASNQVAITPDHLSVYGGNNLAFARIEGDGLDLVAGPVWKKSKETELVVAFADFVKSATRRFTKADFLSRDGADALPFA
ncbi:LysR family transcriptional regulator [Adlercreutzia sp. ZJ242]|uniref:LysR substrate-binding domain-containing protein n=1 Tax=Adlercreutzia sp. ZJ242 TaxID=2709409 RepID=UPI0013ECDF3F|nr:LysR family transcriptional regulator [Adlercreutzia sp. ZJ242]